MAGDLSIAYVAPETVSIDTTDAAAAQPWLNPPPLADPTGNVVRVSSDAELQQAIVNLSAGTTIVLANGTYQLSSTLWIRKDNVTIRGETNDPSAVVLMGPGMENANYGNVPHGIWSDAANLNIQSLTIRDIYFHPIQFSAAADAPRMTNLRLIDAGEQFIKGSSGGFGVGVDNGIVEYTIMEYTNGPPRTDHGGGTGYTNGVDIHGGQNWLIRNNLFKDFHTPDSAQHLWNPAILMWNGAGGTISERNTFVNVDRAIAYGLTDRATSDHSGGIIRNNFVYAKPQLFSSSRKSSSDGQIIVWDSPNTQVLHNTILTNGNFNKSIEFRFGTVGGVASNNLVDAPLGSRGGASFGQSGNVTSATPALFVDAANADLHLNSTASVAIDVVDLLAAAAEDIDGNSRPQGARVDAGADEFLTTPVNLPPTIDLTELVESIVEDANTSSSTRVADIVISDDGRGTNTLSLGGADSSLFSIVGGELHLNVGVVLSHASNPTLDVTVSVDDSSVGDTPDDSASISIAVLEVNANLPPKAEDDLANITEDAGADLVSGNVLTNDSDPNGDPLNVVRVGGSEANLGQMLLGQFGSLLLRADGSFDYTLDNSNSSVNDLDNGQSLTESFTYTASDGELGDTATLSITIHGHTDPIPDLQRSDIVGRSGNSLTLAYSTGASFESYEFATLTADWSDVRVGDVDGDNRDDVVGRADGTLHVARTTGETVVVESWGRWSNQVDWNDIQLADVTGDGLDDFVGRTNGRWWVARSTGGSFVNERWATWSTAIPWLDVHAADVNGDQKDDLIGRRNGVWWAALSNGTSFDTERWGNWSSKAQWEHVRIADVDGNGLNDVVGMASGRWWVAKSTGSGFVNERWAAWSQTASWEDVVIGDFNGDGRDDIAARMDGIWWVARSTGTQFINERWGNWSTTASWLDVQVGDFNGDGRDDIAGRANGRWWVARSNGNDFLNQRWGEWSTARPWSDVLVGNFA